MYIIFTSRTSSDENSSWVFSETKIRLFYVSLCKIWVAQMLQVNEHEK